jgi:DNA-binding response OmpR family regulator
MTLSVRDFAQQALNGQVPPPLPDTSLFGRPLGAAGPRSVLVVDGDPAIRRIATAALQQAGYQVHTAADGTRAMELLLHLAKARRPLDALLLDVHLPNGGGLGFLDALHAAGMVVPVIALTADQERQTVVELLRRGVGEILDKPLRIDAMITQLRTFLERTATLAERRHARETALKAELEAADRARRATQRKADEASDSFYRLDAQMQSARAAWRDLVGVLVPPAGIGLAWRNRPLSDMGGDFVGLRSTGSGCLLLVADVAGHDLGASMHGVLIKAFFDENCRSGMDVSGAEEFMRKLNRQLVQSSEQRRLVTAQLIVIDQLQEQAAVVCAGHPAVLIDRQRVLTPLSGAGSVLGISEQVTFTPATIPLGAGDRLFVCTDGVCDLPRVDGRTGERTHFGLDGLARSLTGAPGLEAAVTRAWDDLTAFCRRKPVDDMLLIGLEVQATRDDYQPTEKISDGASVNAHWRDRTTHVPSI